MSGHGQNHHGQNHGHGHGNGVRGGYVVRDAVTADLADIARFEIDIALVSFGDEAITDPALHTRRVSGAMGRPGEFLLVAVAADDPGRPLGWAWLSSRANALTGARYGNFRSLAVAEHPDRTAIGELLLDTVIERAADAGIVELVGRVHAANLGMRALYRKFDFEAVHLTMRRRLPPGDRP